MSAATVTHHARERGRERLGLKSSSVERMAEIALEKGLRREDTAGALRRYLEHHRKDHPSTHARIYGDVVFHYIGRTLITCYQLPLAHRATVRKLREAKRAA